MNLAMLAGCGVPLSTPATNYNTPVTLQGQVFASRNYMAGAIVKVYETQPNGVAANGIYTGTAKLLTTVTANTTGGWSTTDLSCSSPDQIYVTAEAGVPYPSGQNSTSLANNPNSLMMTAIGDCSILSSATNTNNITSIVTNEASTVAAVWALRNFISLNGTTVNITSSATNYGGTNGVGTPTNFAGLAHAFLNANNLSPYKIGNFQQYTSGAATGANGGLVPVQELNSLAYAQYLCTIGSDGTTSGNFSYCTTLYRLATPPDGTVPTNSLQALLNIARNPANNAIDILNFTLTPIPLSGQKGSQQINAGVYVPALTDFGTLTKDWSVAIYYLPGYGATSNGQGSSVPEYVTIDANDDVYFSNPNASSSSTAGNIVALTSSGQSLWTSATDTTKLLQPRAIAADASGNIWVVAGGTTAATAFVQQTSAATGATVRQYPSTSNTLYGVAVDSLGNVWYDSNTTTGQNLHELLRNGSAYTEATFAAPPSSPTYQLLQIRPDSNNNIWIAGYNTTKAATVYFPNTGTATAPTYATALMFASLPGASSTYGMTTDAAGNAYAVTNGASGGIFKTTVTGTGKAAVLTPTKVAANPAAASRFMDIDGAGSIWYMDGTTGTNLYQYLPSNGTTNSYYPCYNAGTSTGTGTATSTVQTCTTGISTRMDLAVDSTGSIWVASYGNSGGGRMVQILGLAAPTVPLKSLGKPGVMP
ncbi:hypothetical protein [Granulicella sp. dw_53]|uniref:hypothetical protein n=1 Tax=Granulicella sp. dw_53 TaxID=2719792 RepID=UPI001BD26C6E|nr:hypothetical protein [Granulicella sp. dw_53]